MHEHRVLSNPVGNEAEQIASQDDFPSLVRALTRTQGFGLYVVECDDPAYGRKVAGVVRERLSRPVVDVDLGEVDRSPTRPAIDSVLEQQLTGAPEDAAVFVWNLDHLLPSTDADEAVTRQTLTEINWRRGFFARLGCPLVLWLPKYAIRPLARHAPDFFDWNSGMYVFSAPADE
jgi:hypothetical protein